MKPQGISGLNFRYKLSHRIPNDLGVTMRCWEKIRTPLQRIIDMQIRTPILRKLTGA
jgi:hypothetical protein